MAIINYRYLLFFETTIMGNTADLALVQKTIIDTFHKEGESQKGITERGGSSQSILAYKKHIKCKVDWKEEIRFSAYTRKIGFLLKFYRTFFL